MADVLVPEVDHEHPLINEVTDILNKTPVAIDKLPSKVKVELSIELLVLIGLPLMGFSGDPLTYSPIDDTYKAFTRELLLRILRGFDHRKASAYLSLLE
jgi:hypothetical protein